MLVAPVWSVTLTCPLVVVVLMVFIVETGISLMELDCHLLKVLAFMRLVSFRGLIYVVIMMILNLESIIVIFQLFLSMILITLQWETDQSMLDFMPMMEVYTFEVHWITMHSYIVCRKSYNIWRTYNDSETQWSQSSVHPHLYLHWWTCYHCHLDQRLHHCHRRNWDCVKWPSDCTVHPHSDCDWETVWTLHLYCEK